MKIRIVMKYSEMNWGTMEAVVNKLGGMDGVQRFLSGDLVVKSATPSDLVLKVWKTIKLGTGLKTADDFRKALKKSNCGIGDWANDILGKPAFTASETEMDANLVIVSVGELGFKDGATRKDIYERAQSLGLSLCPAEVGPQLRLQYTDQPKNEWLVIGMEPITHSDGDLLLFDVGRDDDGEQWLSTYYGGADGVWDAGYRFVFLSRK